jgi:putative DNA primase/helicase
MNISTNATKVNITDEVFPNQQWTATNLHYGKHVENAKAFYDARQRPLVYWRNEFFEYTGTHYRVLSTAAIRTEIYSFLDHAFTKHFDKDANEGAGEWKKAPYRFDTIEVRELLSALQCLAGKTFVSDRANAPCWLHGAGDKPDPRNLIALQNKIVDLVTGETFPHSPDFLSTTVLPYAYDPKAECPEWQKFIDSVSDDPAWQRELQKAIGYMLSNDRSQQKLFLMKGPRRSGKGTMIRVMAGLIGGENVVSSKLNQVGTRFGQEQLIGTKAAFFPDERLDKGTAPAVAWLLSISGEDDVSIERKNLRNWKGRPETKIWISTNVTPGFDDASATIASRFVVFMLHQSFAANPDKGLTKKLLAELPGIFNYAVEGIRMLREDGEFIQSAEGEEVIERMSNIAAPIRIFARDRLVFAEGESVEMKLAHRTYKVWCEVSGNRAMSLGKFEDAILEFDGVTSHKHGPRGAQVLTLHGVRLRQAGEDAEEPEVETPAADPMLDDGEPGNVVDMNAHRRA